MATATTTIPTTTTTERRPGRRPKTTWPPCACCGDPDGRVAHGCRTPYRVDGRRFGIEGPICARCYMRLYRREYRHAPEGPDDG